MTSPNPRPRRDSLHQQVARNIRNQIAAGQLRHGQQLPSTRELADEWNVSVFTINEAMKLLTDVVTSRPRAGRVVNAPDQEVYTEVRAVVPQVILIGGFAGSGKSELGRMLARESGWPILDKDTLTRPVVEVALETLGLSPNDRESEGYLTNVRPREYEALINTLIENVQCGNSAIVTAPFVKEFKDLAWLNRLNASCAEMKAVMHVIWVYCDPETMHTYIRHRGAARDSHKLGNWEKYIGQVDTEFRPEFKHFTVNNSASGDPLQSQARELISKMLKGE